MGKKEVGDPVDASRIVYFPTNTENYDVIYENTFVDAYNVSVTWEVKQESNKNMEKKNGHSNTLNVNAEDNPVEESAKALGEAVNEFINTNRTTTETKETK